ncbi:hypothetical protein E2C01_043465 [Portunus trituberculatus]|uniref:Uncharacterized protein n=1 Tax=Portunus trituberculatus TaxID=210409 RepID=A0A5B7FWG7_PORTR|nr:hypothetical protein [Portunus trituberculatus]
MYRRLEQRTLFPFSSSFFSCMPFFVVYRSCRPKGPAQE